MRVINNNIQESYCSFEVSKLLKEKGFNCYTNTWHQRGNGIVGDVVGKSDRYNSKGEAYTSCPTHALAIEWIRVNFGIWIYSNQTSLGNWIGHMNSLETKLYYNTPQEAESEALWYVLKKLI